MRIYYAIYGEGNIDATINQDTEKERRMDIFLCNTSTVETAFQTSL